MGDDKRKEWEESRHDDFDDRFVKGWAGSPLPNLVPEVKNHQEGSENDRKRIFAELTGRGQIRYDISGE